VLIEQKQRVVAEGLEVPVIRAPFLRPMYRALARIHVEHDPVGARRELRLREQLSVHRHQPDEILRLGQQLGLEPVQRRRQRRTPVPDLRRPDQTKRGICREALRVVKVLIASQVAVNRLPQAIR
jgi:hypothetical protein